MFVTNCERTANNRREMGWIVEEVNVSKPKSALIKIHGMTTRLASGMQIHSERVSTPLK